jgi:hypothetical protein
VFLLLRLSSPERKPQTIRAVRPIVWRQIGAISSRAEGNHISIKAFWVRLNTIRPERIKHKPLDGWAISRRRSTNKNLSVQR